MKKRLSALFAALLLTFSVLSASAEDFFVGDIDFSGEIDASDLTALAKHVGGIEALAETDALLYASGGTFASADLDLDGTVGASDLTALAKQVGGIEALSVEGSVKLPEEDEPLNHLRVNMGDLNFLDLSLADETLTVSGCLVCDGLDGVIFHGVGERTDGALYLGLENCIFYEKLDAQRGMGSEASFTLTLPLDSAKNTLALTVYTHIAGEESYWSIFKKLPITRTEDGFVFASPLVLENNLSALALEVDPAECLNAFIPDAVQTLSDEIVGEETDDYRKMFLINKWLAENLYYDYDFYYGSGELYIEPEDIIEHRRTVCSGYARLQRLLLQAQGIPAITVFTYSASDGITEADAGETESNHEHCEAYLASEGRWVTMDATWDCHNTYQNGQFEKQGPSAYVFFDASPVFFSYTHKIVQRPCPDWYYD